MREHAQNRQRRARQAELAELAHALAENERRFA